MVRYPPAKLGARKRTIIDLIDDDDRGTPVQDSIPSVRREDKPRRRKPRMPPGAKADTSEAKKNEICDTKQSLQSEPKVFIKATESRVKEGILEEAKNDASSYALGLTTYVEQAEREPDFIGDAFYYNLTKATLYPDLAGEYIILYTRPMGKEFDQQARSATLSPTPKNKIIIVTDPPQGRSEVGRNVQQILAAGSWAAGTLVFQGMHCLLGCDKLPDDIHSSNRNSSHVKLQLTEVNRPECLENPFQGHIIIEAGSSISFGLKVMTEKWNYTSGQTEFFGFHFVKLEIPYVNHRTGNAGRQVLVAVKIPRAGDGNVSSAFILKQKLCNTRDICLAQSDTRVRNLADWQTYAVREGYYDHIPSREWSPRFPTRVGLLDVIFCIATFEKYLLTVEDPIRELRNLTVWIHRFSAPRPAALEEDHIYEAWKYWESRYQAMRGELRLREEAGAREDLLLVSEESTDGEQASHVGWKRGDMNKTEPKCAPGEIVYQGPGRGTRTSPIPLHSIGRSHQDGMEF